MTTLKTMMAALLAGSLAVTAGGLAYAKIDGHAFDPAKFQQRIDKRVDKALNGTDATAEQKKKVADILGTTFKDMKPLHDRRVENRKAMADAMQAPTIDPAKIEALRAEQMKIADASSKRFTKALTDAGDVLTRPAAPGFLQELERASASSHHGKRGVTSGAARPDTGLMAERILMIDDDDRLAGMVSDYLGGAGFRLTIAGTARDGEALLKRESFDAVILDLMLPDTDGLDLCRRLRARRATCRS